MKQPEEQQHYDSNKALIDENQVRGGKITVADVTARDNVGLVIHEKYQEDKRRTVNKYFATLDGISISPVLDYENLNHFILGFSKAKSIFNY